MMTEEIIPAVQIDNLTKIFPVPFRKEKVIAVDDLSLCVEAGEVYGLIGPNGSGKSTLLKAASRALRPTTGAVYLNGKDLAVRPVAELARELAALEIFMLRALS